MRTVAGCDDAGRGPVIGPMVIAGVLVAEDQQDALWQMGVKDSKLLTPLQREHLFDKIISFVQKYVIILISPQEIDASLMGDTTNLNWLEGQKFARVISQLHPDCAIVDCPSSNQAAYTKFLGSLIPAGIELICVHKADTTYAACAAASILAKVTRDREIAQLKEKYHLDFGSGYPADPLTQKFLKQHYATYPELFRTTWATYKKVAGQKGLDQF